MQQHYTIRDIFHTTVGGAGEVQVCKKNLKGRRKVEAALAQVNAVRDT